MSVEADVYLQKACRCLTNAQTMVPVGLNEDAGRNAYLAAFHAAQALILERTGREAKTHRGVRSEFLRLTHAEPGFPAELRRFLSQGYELKTIADYGTDVSSMTTEAEATAAIEVAGRFVAAVVALLGLSP